MRDDPDFAGKNGNFVDWKDTDSFRVCRTATGAFATAETADCVANGATSNAWGKFDTDPARLDTNFDGLGVVAGGAYTIKVYSGTGWKTVNGQAGVTPIATYTSTLENLPMSTVALAGTPAAPVIKFPLLVTSSLTAAQFAAAINAKAAFSSNLTWNLPGAMPDGRATALNTLYSFEQGRATSGANFNPASRQFNPSFPAPNAVAATLSVPAAVPALVTPTYFEAALEYSNRNGNFIRSLATFQ
ncbi:hypothetical protein LP416_15345 [Polaromonas sp. P2-4]|nr:hypothetical protein LP416_15345 [Polaromonas sp. P2-4]